MENKYVSELILTVGKINKLNNKNEKIEAIYHLTSYAAFLNYCGKITFKDYAYIVLRLTDDPWEKAYDKERDMVIHELFKNNILLGNYYKNHMLLYNKNNFIPKEAEYSFKIRIYKEFREFLKYMKCDKLYNHLLRNHRISFSSTHDNSLCLNDRDESYILIIEKNPFDRYFVMSHEIAHAYENMIMKDFKTYFERGYNTEIFSLLFNRIFMNYLIDNNCFSIEEKNLLINNFEYNYYNFIFQSYFITEMIKSSKYIVDDYELIINIPANQIVCDLTNHNYALGSIISLYLLNKWRKSDTIFINNLPNQIKDIRHMNLSELLNNFDDKKIFNEEINRIKSKLY